MICNDCGGSGRNPTYLGKPRHMNQATLMKCPSCGGLGHKPEVVGPSPGARSLPGGGYRVAIGRDEDEGLSWPEPTFLDDPLEADLEELS